MAFANEALHILAATVLGNRKLLYQQPVVNDIEFGLRLYGGDSGTKPSSNQHPAVEGCGPALAVGLQSI